MTYPPGEWTPLAADASARRYFVGRVEGREVLLADFGGDADGLERFVYVRALLEGCGVPVPEIYEARSEEGWILQEFVRGRPLSRARWTEDLQRAVLNLARGIGSMEGWSDGPELLQLDGARLRFELAFFKVHFVEGFLNCPAPGGLAPALDALAEEVASYPQVMAHRDFHSENLLERKGGGLVVVDFQDALLAPRAYDAASLAVDPYRKQGRRLDETFKSLWLAGSATRSEEFDRTALQRSLKALGTFGYQITRRKRARYMRFVGPQALRTLDLLSSSPVSLACLGPLLEGLPV